MAVEIASYISQLDTTLPTAADLISEGDDHIRLAKTVLKTQFPNFGTAAITASAAEVNYLVGVTSGIQAQFAAKANKAGETYTGAHNFTGASVTVPTASVGDATNKAASTAFVSTTAFSAVLPGQAGNAGRYVKTDGAAASWSLITFADLTSMPTTLSGYGITNAVTTNTSQTITGAKSFTGNVLQTGSGGIGFGVGSGGVVTQLTSKSTNVTINKLSGQITTNNAALAGNTSVPFYMNNSLVAQGDQVLVSLFGGGSLVDNYSVRAGPGSGGIVRIVLKNETAGSLSDAVDIYFSVIKGAIA